MLQRAQYKNFFLKSSQPVKCFQGVFFHSMVRVIASLSAL